MVLKVFTNAFLQDKAIINMRTIDDMMVYEEKGSKPIENLL
jgi:hypothetical protein